MSIDSSCERTKFECIDEEMTKLLNVEVEMPIWLDATRLHTGSVFRKDSQAYSYPSKSKWCHIICNLEDNLGNMMVPIVIPLGKKNFREGPNN